MRGAMEDTILATLQNMLTLISAVLILIGHVPDVTCQTGPTAEDVKALKQKLFVTNAYDYKVRPINNQSMPIVITIDLRLLSINEVNEAKETIKTTAYLKLQWNDEFLKWTPTDHNNITEAFWLQGDVWKPDIALKNSNLEYKELGVRSLNVYNTYNGSVFWYPFQVFESTCSIDTTNFPFDYQTCYLTFQAWSYWKYQVEMKGGSMGIDIAEYEPNAAWDIIDSSWSSWIVEEDSEDSTISFSLTIRRKPLYIMLSVTLPIMALAILNLCVFLLPTHSGEKAGYSITVFLAFAVFLTIVSTSLPQNSETVALIQVFLIIQTICSTLTTVLTLTLLRMSSFDEKVAIPRILVFFMRCLKCKACSKGSMTVPKQIRPTESRMPDESSTGDVEYSWKEVVNFLDVVLFVIFVITLFASSIGCFLAALYSKP